MTLLLLAPVVAEVLSGATRISYLVVLIPEIMVWGCGALPIREIVLRWRGSWTSVLLLGLALSVAEEFIIQQTSIAPLPWLGSRTGYGRALGVNWVYFLYMLGYESVWVVLVPIHLTQLIFPERRNENWLRTRGLCCGRSDLPARILHRMVHLDATGANPSVPRGKVSAAARAYHSGTFDDCVADDCRLGLSKCQEPGTNSLAQSS